MGASCSHYIDPRAVPTKVLLSMPALFAKVITKENKQVCKQNCELHNRVRVLHLHGESSRL